MKPFRNIKQHVTRFTAFIVFILMLVLTSCSDSTIFDEAVKLDHQGWNAADKPAFGIVVTDTTSTYSVAMHIRNHVDYRYSNLYVFMQTRFPNGNLTRDTIECILADPSGKWYGKGSGQFRDHLIVLNPAIRFPLSGTYQIELEQAMRAEPLQDIHAIGLQIRKNIE